MDAARLIAGYLTKYGGAVGVKPCVLVKSSPGVRRPDDLTAGTLPNEIEYEATGWVEDYGPQEFAGTIITEQDRKISILGASLPAGVSPAARDKVTIADADGVDRTYVIQAPVQNDAIGAVYVLIGRA